ncbi:Uncharacterized protein, UPF0305 family [Methanobrevibacter olleyae]|uniref:UPF0305 protein SAMN02910297_01774 n=2 Tax=Methanobrevibacter olleyae TaxID=294671 RepID=A0A126QYH6_METOL|nr:hypothetical protein YLM1_0656 [Methanobrevibacter olleyae]SFL79514.1 Uncharacterized protein, UPF0305 family [Methanobrevibacter olleyae]
MYEDFKNVLCKEETASKKSLLKVLKEHAGTISVFDLMSVSAEMTEDTKYVQEEYREKTNEVYVKYFLGRIKDIRDDENNYEGHIDKKEFIDSIATLKSYQKEESISSKTKFPLIYAIVSLYTTYILEEPIHPVGTPFPGSLKVEEKDGVFYCPVKEANLESPNAVCRMCLAEQLDF